MKFDYDHMLFAAITCAILMVAMANGDAFAQLGTVFAQ